MSIPKEPRQLMINLMYLVLTAMLALNVSAEIINAFFLVDKGIKRSNVIVDLSNDGLKAAIDKQAAGYSQFKPLASKASQVREISKEFTSYIQEVRDTMITASGGPYKNKKTGEIDLDKPKNKKDKDITTRFLVDAGNGQKIYDKIIETRAALLALVDSKDRTAISANLPLSIDTTGMNDDGTWGENAQPDWANFTFKQLPIAACMPIFRKFQNDSKTSETAILNYLFNKTGVDEIKFDAFQPVISASKGYILKGETYKADVFLSAYSKTAGNITISVDGSRLSVKEGQAKYSRVGSSVGSKKYNVSISIKNPVTGKTDQYKKTFEYEVGESSASIQLNKMNVFYVGVDNPIEVSVAGVSSNKVRVNASGVTATGGNGKYNIRASNPGNATLTVTGGDLRKEFKYRVKRIPDPIARLGRENSGALPSGTFKAQGGVGAWLDDFDFDAKCKIQGFSMTRVAKRKDPVDAVNRGARFAGTAASLVAMAKPGDTYYFDNIKAFCPGDKAGRKINSLVFKIR